MSNDDGTVGMMIVGVFMLVFAILGMIAGAHHDKEIIDNCHTTVLYEKHCGKGCSYTPVCQEPWGNLAK